MKVGSYKKICLLDDLLRPEFTQARKFIYTCIKEPLRQATGLILPDLSNFPLDRGLSETYKVDKFLTFLKGGSWVEHYNRIPDDAEKYLLSCIPEEAIVIGYEMPPWLIIALENNNTPYVSIRISPIKFCRDLYLTIDGNIDSLNNAKIFNVSEDEIRIEAGIFSASVQQKTTRKLHKAMENSVLFIGQTRKDASLINENGRVLTVTDFVSEIQEITNSKNLIYMPHPYDLSFAKSEFKKIKREINLKASMVKCDTYNLLASDIPFEAISISSGACQESLLFNRESHFLYKPICNPWSALHVRFLDFCSPVFWGLGLNATPTESQHIRLSYHPDNTFRRFHDVWWGYSDFMINNDQFWLKAYKKSRKKEIYKYIENSKALIKSFLGY